MSLREKAITGAVWNAISRFSSYGLEFIIGVILARILSPEDFGIIASITVIIAFLEVFINSGYSQALIRQKEFDNISFSTVFWFNLLIGIFVYILIYFTAPQISYFFTTGDITRYIQVLSITLLINSVSLIQRTILTKNINFKKQTIIAVISTIISGILAITLAVNGYGIWSLVFKIVLFRLVESILLWTMTHWKPLFNFSITRFKTLTIFASRLLISGVIDVVFKNINYIIISKYFSAKTLGFYTRAEMFKNLPSQNLTAIMTTVSYPTLSAIQDDRSKLTQGFVKVFTITYYISSILMFTLLGVSENLILTLLGDKWEEAVLILQLLCLVGLFNPINSLCGNLLNVVGRSNIYLNLQIISNVLLVPAIIIGVLYGINSLIISNLVISIGMYFFFGYHSSRFIDYSLKSQLLDVGGKLIYGLILCLCLLSISFFINLSPILLLILQGIFTLIYILGIGEFFKVKEYIYLKQLLKRYGN